MNWLRRHPAGVTATFVVGFVLLRAAMFAVTTAGEYRLYRDYGEAARRTSLAELYHTRDVEYPHLAVAFGVLPAVIADALPDWTTHLVGWRPNKFEYPYVEETPTERVAGDKYEVALSLVLLAVDAGCLGLVYLIARRVYPADDHLARTGRLAGYALTVGSLGLIVYDRQDLVVGAVALLALWALAANRPRVGYGLLALGAAYKLVPVLLLPVWVLAAAAGRTTLAATTGRYLRAVVYEAVFAGVVLTAWPVNTYLLGGGERAFVFLSFHTQRGLQLEAPAAWPVLLLDPATAVGHGFGSYNLVGDLADRVARPTRLLMPLAVLASVAISARGFWQLRGQPLARLIPHVVAASLLVWLAFILTNKVGSPQYLLWVAPLVPLLPLRTWPERSWALLLLVTMILTTVIFPCRYYPDLIGPVADPATGTRRGPTALGLFLMAAKSITLAVTTGWLAVSVWRAPRAEAPGVPPASPRPESKP